MHICGNAGAILWSYSPHWVPATVARHCVSRTLLPCCPSTEITHRCCRHTWLLHACWGFKLMSLYLLSKRWATTPLQLCFLYFFIHFFIFKDLIILYMSVHCSCFQTHQKRASDPIMNGCELPCGCWDLNSGPSEEQPVLLTTEPSLQPQPQVFILVLYQPSHYLVSTQTDYFETRSLIERWPCRLSSSAG
jgi:hypothetical protein